MKAPPLGMAREIICAETNDGRFEEFCRAILSVHEGGVPILSTSPTWDLARDGKTLGPNPIFLCCSLNDDVDIKAEKDIKRVVSKAKAVGRIYFCTSQPLSEHGREKLRDKLSSLVSSGTEFEVLSARELADLDSSFCASGRSESIVSRHYPAEVSDCLKRLEEDRLDTPADAALRTALIAIGPEESSEIRASVYRVCILDVLAKTGGTATKLTANEIARAISDALRLGRAIRVEAIQPYLTDLAEQRHVAASADGRYSLTEDGAALANDIRTSNASSNLLRGRAVVREKVDELLGEKLLDAEFNPLWQSIEAGIAHILYSRGESLVRAAAAVLESGDDSTAIQDLRPTICEVTEKAVCHVQDGTRRRQIARAIEDMLVEPTGPACQWLMQMCANFVVVCALGLEAQTAAAIRKAVRTLDLVLDTDVVLSLLCEGEALHESTKRAVTLWSAEGGRLLVADPVLHEVAHHAWIAENDFRDVASWFPGSDEDGHRFISNAFVRAFAWLARSGRAKKREWDSYIRQFKGSSIHDATATERQLKDTRASEKLPTVKPEAEQIGSDLLATLEADNRPADISGSERKRRLDKAQRDATLVASISRRRKALREQQAEGTCCLVSSSGRLRELSQRLAPTKGDPPWVISVATWTYMLSVLPGAQMSLLALQAFLFDAASQGSRLAQVERLSLRALRRAGEWGFGWSKRITLADRLHEAIIDTARALGCRPTEVEEMVTKPTEESAATAATILAQALEQIPADRRVEKELETAKLRIHELEAEVARLTKSRQTVT